MVAMLAQEVKERPIIFGAESVRTILDGRKTQTRRVLKFPPHTFAHDDSDWVKSVHRDGQGNWIAWSAEGKGLAEFTELAYPNGEGFPCPYGKPGDRLWVRETWATYAADEGTNGVVYRSDLTAEQEKEERSVRRLATDLAREHPWHTPIFMPRWASRITLELTEVRPERLTDIAYTDHHADVISEGVRPWPTEPYHFVDCACLDCYEARRARTDAFIEGWNKLNAARGYGWSDNPWVWVLSFKRV